mmetsp:Transcript_21091/g.52139  ORF Transcript_21091/g.52139 Transcript_21091/m.52139 type:complete len:241 (-) Transcript_21091:75-797(-)
MSPEGCERRPFLHAHGSDVCASHGGGHERASCHPRGGATCRGVHRQRIKCRHERLAHRRRGLRLAAGKRDGVFGLFSGDDTHLVNRRGVIFEEGGERDERGCALDARRRERLICGSSGGSAGFARIGGGSSDGRGGGGGTDRGVLADPVEAPSSSDGGGIDAPPGGDERAGNAVSRSVSLGLCLVRRRCARSHVLHGTGSGGIHGGGHSPDGGGARRQSRDHRRRRPPRRVLLPGHELAH